MAEKAGKPEDFAMEDDIFEDFETPGAQLPPCHLHKMRVPCAIATWALACNLSRPGLESLSWPSWVPVPYICASCMHVQ